MTTEILRLDEITASQSSKEVTHNKALRQIEGQSVRVLSMTTTAQPVSPVEGDTYIVPTGATGSAWAGRPEHIAHFYSGSWKFYVPKPGFHLWVVDQNVLAYYPGVSGEGWRTATPLSVDLLSPSTPTDGDFLRFDGLSAQWFADPFYSAEDFTPDLTFATPGDLSVSYSVQTGRIVKIGRQVTARINITTSVFTFTTASGQLQITGLSFASRDVSVGSLTWGGITKAGYTDISAVIEAGSSTVILRASGSGVAVADVDEGDCPSGGTMELQLTLVYES